MTIRILEDGDYRLQESGCIRDLQQSARVLENLELRTYENADTRQIEDAKALTLQLQNCCGSRSLENGPELPRPHALTPKVTAPPRHCAAWLMFRC